MRRLLAVLTILAMMAPVLRARRVEGRVHCGSRLLSGIVVTDGVNFVKTGPEGTFRLETSDDKIFISVVVPAGFSLPADGFFQRLEGRRWFDFNLQAVYSLKDYSLMALHLPALKSEENLEIFRRDILPPLSEESLRLRIAGKTVALLFGQPSAEAISELKKTEVSL